MTLPPSERAEIVEALLASLDGPDQDDPEVVRAVWAEELQRRVARALSGEAPGEPWPAVRDRIRSDLAR